MLLHKNTVETLALKSLYPYTLVLSLFEDSYSGEYFNALV